MTKHTGVWFLKNKDLIDYEKLENDYIENINEVHVTTVPARFHNDPEVIKAKEEELNKWKQFDAYEEVLETEDMSVLSASWVVVEKNDTVKARLCVRGFEEEVYPQSDSPTATNDSLKLFLATVANQEFPIRNLDVTSAFLQGAPLDRNVYMEPPTEVKEVGKIWKLKKSAYGFYDASRK